MLKYVEYFLCWLSYMVVWESIVVCRYFIKLYIKFKILINYIVLKVRVVFLIDEWMSSIL